MRTKIILSVLLSGIILALTACQGTANGLDKANHEATDGVNDNASGTVKRVEMIDPILTVSYPEAIGSDDLEADRMVREQNPVEESFLKALDCFSYRTASAVLKNSEENANYSPLSLYYALAIAGAGAGGETQSQILDLLGASDSGELSVQCGNLYRQLYLDHEISKLKIANSVWMDRELDYKNDFINNAAKNFYASSYLVDFADESTGSLMGQWIEENTNGTLSPILPTNAEQILSIINTVYLYDEWTNGFNDENTAKDIFHAPDGDIAVDFMNKTDSSAGYTKGEGFLRASLGLKGNGEMVFILPDEGRSISELLDSAENVQELFEGGENGHGEVVWKLPKFNFDAEYKLVDVLKTLGMTEAFQLDADFSGITDETAFISDVIQETHIAIDENGVEASAFTSILYCGDALPNGRAEMILNRPFIYGITARNGALLFVGICNNPAE